MFAIRRRWKDLGRALSVVAAAMLLVHCGTKVGNPDSDDDTTVTAAFLPTVEFTIPDSVTSLALNLQPGNGSNSGSSGSTPDLIPVVKRVDRVIRDINTNLERLRNDGVDGVGDFSGVGPNQLISGSVVASTSADYDYTATVCYQDVPFYVIEWNEDGTKVHFIRDFATSPLVPANRTNGIIDVTYDQTADPASVQMLSNIVPWQRTLEDTDGDNLADSTFATKSSADFFQFRSASDYYDTTLGTPEGDYYVVGQFDGEANGDFVAYRKNHQFCTTFDETNTAAPGWCLSRPLRGDELTVAERDELWTNTLSPIGIEPAANIAIISLPADAACSSGN